MVLEKFLKARIVAVRIQPPGRVGMVGELVRQPVATLKDVANLFVLGNELGRLRMPRDRLIQAGMLLQHLVEVLAPGQLPRRLRILLDRPGQVRRVRMGRKKLFGAPPFLLRQRNQFPSALVLRPDGRWSRKPNTHNRQTDDDPRDAAHAGLPSLLAVRCFSRG